jgi:hypothetical protein
MSPNTGPIKLPVALYWLWFFGGETGHAEHHLSDGDLNA